MATWRFGPLSASRPWAFEERTKPPLSFGGQEKPYFSYLYRGTDAEGELLYGAGLMASGPTEIERKPHVNGKCCHCPNRKRTFGPHLR